MINKLDNVLVELEEKEKQLRKDLEVEVTDKKKEELLKIDDIITAITKLKGVPDQSKIDQITRLLKKMDDDHDGSLKIDDVLKVRLFIFLKFLLGIRYKKCISRNSMTFG